ncbi:hypothetical protein [Cryobacterium psychrophilum]|uniref:Uncharacterized protein n=1 Tax=Cryobacterium psychrophilum TaxID=41988 RepID=A0A4Y8KKD4_9MICO|nr:hypothetical protein [Cryobacterium psychrophilum]TFD75536.1 hypothetical protein E3T53_15710 [Cryobacterium psychrophilum]
MGRTASGRGGWASWVNRKLLPLIGPPPLGPYPVIVEAEVAARKARSLCPICGALMSLHEVDRSGTRTQIFHPTPEEIRERSAPPES